MLMGWFMVYIFGPVCWCGWCVVYTDPLPPLGSLLLGGKILMMMLSLCVVVQADEGDVDTEAGMEVDAAESKQVYKPAKLAPVYYGQ